RRALRVGAPRGHTEAYPTGSAPQCKQISTGEPTEGVTGPFRRGIRFRRAAPGRILNARGPFMTTSYEDVPYGNLAHPASHPDRLATVATLFGLTPPPVARCRVLELGCAAGGNLLPMALAFPDSTFVGVELSPRQVAEGRATAAALGLTNVELRAQDILDLPDSFGPFDYVIAHGVYSWVPPAVQDKL